jgi:hypothetical protein
VAATLVDVAPGEGAVVTVVESETGRVVGVVDVDVVESGRVVDDDETTGAAMGVNGPGLTCSPAAATICQARTVVRVVAATQIVMRPYRFMKRFSQQKAA